MVAEAKQKKKSKKDKSPPVEVSASLDVVDATGLPTEAIDNADVNQPHSLVPNEDQHEVNNEQHEHQTPEDEYPAIEPPTIESNLPEPSNDKNSKKSKSKKIKEKKPKEKVKKQKAPEVHAELPVAEPQIGAEDAQINGTHEAPNPEVEPETKSKRSGSKRSKVKSVTEVASRGLSGIFTKKGDHETGESGAETDVVVSTEEKPKTKLRKSKSKKNSPAETNGLQLTPNEDYIMPPGEPLPIDVATKRKKKSKRFKNNEQLRSSHAFKEGELVRAYVRLLDDEMRDFVVHRKSFGRELIETVCDYLNLAERDYFGLRFLHETGVYFWLDSEKEIRKQMEDAQLKYTWEFEFRVKFYPPEPSLLQEELTRYLLCLQVRRELISPHGELRNCSFVTQALLGSYIAQSELGDYEPELESAVRAMHFSARQDPRASEYLANPEENRQVIAELFDRIIELYRTHEGIRPDEADYRFLENAKRLELYGIEFVEANDAGGMPIRVGVYYGGIVVYHGRVRISRFAWPKVLKLSYHGANFKVRVRPESDFRSGSNIPVQETVVFCLQDARVAKRLWKSSVEQHTFYRKKGDEMRKKATGVSRIGTLVNTIGSSRFHYSGRTLYQYRTGPIRHDPPPPVYRTLQKGQARSMPALERDRVSQSGQAIIASSRDIRDTRPLLTPLELEPATLPRINRHGPEPPNPRAAANASQNSPRVPARPPPPKPPVSDVGGHSDFESNVDALTALISPPDPELQHEYVSPSVNGNQKSKLPPPPPPPVPVYDEERMMQYNDTSLDDDDPPIIPPKPGYRAPVLPPRSANAD